MSSTTTQLRYVVTQLLDDLELENTESNWSNIYSNLGLSDYPIFDETHRSTLNNKIIRHYYFQEISSETLAQFKWRLRDAMCLIMPRYNWMYEQIQDLENLENKGFYTNDDSWTETYTDNKNDVSNEETTRNKNNVLVQNNTTTSKDTTNENNKNIFEDTPMSLLENSGTNGPTIEGLDYATNVTIDNNTSLSDTYTENNSNSINDDTETIGKEINFNSSKGGTKTHTSLGFNKSAYEQTKDRIDAFRNVDLEIINDPYIKRCFLGVWL